MTGSFTPRRADMFRTALIEHVETTRHRTRRLLVGTGMVLAGALAGAGVSTAAYAMTGSSDGTPTIDQPSSDLGAVQAPEGVSPGAPIVSLLGDATSLTVTGDLTVPLDDRPDGATHVRMAVVALTPGSVSWSDAPGGSGPRAVLTESDVDAGTTTSEEVPLDTDALHFTPADGFTGVVTLQYVNHVATHLGVNAGGETFGVGGGPDGEPDLILAEGTEPSGTPVEGYVRRSELEQLSPDHPAEPSTPGEALTWQDEVDESYPNGWEVPLYLSDGSTEVGTFHVGS